MAEVGVNLNAGALAPVTDEIVLDAGDITGPPVATIHLPRPIPAGFHGAWIPA
jgi:carotenoid cleavage dioxygenase